MNIEFDLEDHDSRILVATILRRYEGLGLAEAVDKIKAVEAGTAPAEISAHPVPPLPAAKKTATKNKTPVTDVLGPPDDANGQDQDDMGLVPPSLSPGEAKDQALALVREVYAAGHVAEVKNLQKEWNVAKFYDVPVEKGGEFYQRVMKLAVSVGIRQ